MLIAQTFFDTETLRNSSKFNIKVSQVTQTTLVQLQNSNIG